MKQFIKSILTKRRRALPYLFEFLLLFLAVYLGFLAESYRESYEKSNKAKSYINGVINDLEIDQKEQLNVSEDLKRYSGVLSDLHKSLDSLLLDGNMRKFIGLIKPLSDGYKVYRPIKSSYSQLSNGGFALIRDPSIIDSINLYYNEIEHLESNFILFAERVKAFQDAQLGWFNWYEAQKQINDSLDLALKTPVKRFVFPNSEKDINNYFIMTRSVAMNAQSISETLESINKRAQRISQFLRKKLKSL